VDTTTVIIIVLVALVVIALLVGAFMAQRRREQAKRAELRDRFGPEYDRAVQQHGSEGKAARDLGEVAKTRDKLDIRPLTPEQQRRYDAEWLSVQTAFVDAPESAVHDADRLVGDVMRDRGYPVDDFDAKADMVRADHPEVAEHYRAATAIRQRTEAGSGGYTTEDCRQAFMHYRALFAELLEGEAGRHRVDMSDRERTDQDAREVDLTKRERTAQESGPGNEERR